mmetsp:Transcript_71647/g.149512  ORF Transcript_71647/g.149512 Transcript_71647/m.149512 type:complete len:200 (+) Transcript_71647:177-776(+)
MKSVWSTMSSVLIWLNLDWMSFFVRLSCFVLSELASCLPSLSNSSWRSRNFWSSRLYSSCFSLYLPRHCNASSSLVMLTAEGDTSFTRARTTLRSSSEYSLHDSTSKSRTAEGRRRYSCACWSQVATRAHSPLGNSDTSHLRLSSCLSMSRSASQWIMRDLSSSSDILSAILSARSFGVLFFALFSPMISLGRGRFPGL